MVFGYKITPKNVNLMGINFQRGIFRIPHNIVFELLG